MVYKNLRSSSFDFAQDLRALKMGSEMVHRKQLQPGLSLLEFLIAGAILGIISALVAGIYFAHFRIFSNQNNAIDVSTQNKLALEEISNQIRQSESIVSTCPSCGGDTTGASVLILRLWPLDGTGEPIDPQDINYDYLVYKRDPINTTKLTRTTYAYASSSRKSGTHVVATNINSLDFTYDNPTPASAGQVTISVSTTATGTSTNKVQTTIETSKANLRNK